MSPDDEPDLPRTGSEVQAQRLGFALRSLAAELVDERPSTRSAPRAKRSVNGEAVVGAFHPTWVMRLQWWAATVRRTGSHLTRRSL
jgi:hypothetical protein